MEAPKKRRRRRRRTARAEAWRGNSAGHRKAAKKGWRKKKRKSTRRRSRRASESVMQASRRPAHRRRRRMGASRGRSSNMAQMFIMGGAGSVGFLLADGIDRLLATYNPLAAEKPKDKFTSDGNGTLANTLNVASMPNLARAGASIGLIAVPAVASMYVKGPKSRAALQGWAFGSLVSGVKLLVANVLLPALIGKDTSTPAIQKSYIARLYPAETAASINRKAQQTSVSSANAAGALSGAGDVGPFALAAESPYPNAAEALRSNAGVQGPGSDYPTQQNVWGTGEFPTAAQEMYKETGRIGEEWEPGPPPLPGPGPQAPQEETACACLGDGEQYAAFLGDAPKESEGSFVLTV
jgi:hypothetical protein